MDVLDYRGLAPAASLQNLVHGGLPLGQIVDVRRGAVGARGLHPDIMQRHACVIGPAGSGKTRSIVAPWIVALLAAGHSVATVDVKGDLLQEITDCIARRGGGSLGASGLVWDYSAANTHRWNFLSEVTSERRVEAAVVSLLGRQKDADPQPHFYQRDYRWLKGLIKLTLEHFGPAAEPRHMLDLLLTPGALQRFAPASSAAMELRDLASLDPVDFSRDVSGLLNVLSIFQQPTVARSVATSDFMLADVLARPTLLVAVARVSDGRLGEQMSSLLVSQFTLMLLERFGSGTPRPVVLMLDEAPRLKDRMNLEETLSVARGARVGVCLAAQDVAQFGSADQQSALLANCHTYISMYGTSAASADYLSRRLGNRQKEEITHTIGAKREIFEPPTVGRQMTVAPVLGAREIMFPPFSEHIAIVHSQSVSSAPFLVDLAEP